MMKYGGMTMLLLTVFLGMLLSCQQRTIHHDDYQLSFNLRRDQVKEWGRSKHIRTWIYDSHEGGFSWLPSAASDVRSGEDVLILGGATILFGVVIASIGLVDYAWQSVGATSVTIQFPGYPAYSQELSWGRNTVAVPAEQLEHHHPVFLIRGNYNGVVELELLPHETDSRKVYYQVVRSVPTYALDL